MMKRVRKSAKPAKTCEGGTVERPRAFLVIDRTMIIRTKLVIIISRDGATESNVRRRMTTILWLGLLRVFPRFIATVGTVVVVAKDDVAARRFI
jgi:hypothetical protein